MIDPRIKKLTNSRFNKLLVVSYSHSSKYGQTYWNCVCDCGNKKVVRRSHLISGSTVSCGCYNKQRASKWLKSYANSDKHKGHGNPQWKGENASHNSIHQWLNRHYKKEICSYCNIKNKKLDWALLKGKKHSHNRDNYTPLCRSCHLKYDYTDERRRKIGKLLNLARIAKSTKQT